MFDNLIWKVKRLRAMDVRELIYRIKQAARAKTESIGVGRANPLAPSGGNGKIWCDHFPIALNVKQYQAAADRILIGHFDVFAMGDAKLGLPPKWNQDPKTGMTAPLGFGKTLNYRDERIVGDIKYLWEPNRHLELVTLAQAWQQTGDDKYANGLTVLLDSWFDQCPYPLGVNWVSSLEHSVRLLNWSFAWHLIGGDDSPIFSGQNGNLFKYRWLTAIFQHCHFIAGHFSFHSSANNHLLGEYMGLLVGSLTWPMWPESPAWRKTAAEGFEIEAMRQTGEDGVNKEQAFYYHHEVMDMMLLCGLISRANGLEFAPAYWRRLEAMMEFLASVMDCTGNVPMVGDADDAHMVRLSQEPDWSHYRSLLASGAVLFKRGDLAAKAGEFDDKSRWLLGDAGADTFDSLVRPTTEKPRTVFPDAGYYLLGTRFGADDEVRALVDCGSLGYLSIAAHGHADALSMVLSAGGRELLIDPGTYAYHTQKKWRDYFRGTSAHNTVRVDGCDQSEIGGNFLWLRKANAHCEVADLIGDVQRFVGSHDGYQCLADPVKHQREIRFCPADNSFEVLDELQCKDQHKVELCWHFAENCHVTVDGTTIKVKNGNVQLIMEMGCETLRPTILSGQEEPPAGWISRSFDVKTPTNTVVWSGVVRGNACLRTRLSISFDSVTPQ
jgi:hypothetical protein